MAATVVLTAGAALSQAATGAVMDRIPISGVTLAEDNPCTGEDISYEGWLQSGGKTTTTPNGDTNATNIFNVQVHGVGLSSGTEYVIVLSDHVQARYDAHTGNYIQTNNTNQKWLSRGAGGDFSSRSVFHILLQPDGTYTAYVENFDFQCR
jgi:hypothetical protein